VTTISLWFLSQDEVRAVAPTAVSVLATVEAGLRAHGEGAVELPPKIHLDLESRFRGHFNILPGYVEPARTAGVKIVGDYVENYRHDLPSEVGLLILYYGETGVPFAIMDATHLTALRTGAVTGIGAKYLARPDSAIVGHLGARGSARYNLEALCALFPVTEVRITSKRRESYEPFAREMERTLGVRVRPTADPREVVEGADIVVEATRLTMPEVLIREAWLKPGALLVSYGWVMALEPSLPFKVDKLVVDDWRQCKKGGQLFPLIERGELRDEHVHAEIGQVVTGARSGRTSGTERVLFWHRGFAISDIVVGAWVFEQARARGLGRELLLCETGAV
jgi:ornithine cyclodeaminase